MCLLGILCLPAAGQTETSCGWIESQLSEINNIKAGSTRADLEKLFNHDGGITELSALRYVYKKCPYIKVEVEFEDYMKFRKPGSQSPSDRIVRISKPYLEHPFLD